MGGDKITRGVGSVFSEQSMRSVVIPIDTRLITAPRVLRGLQCCSC